MNNQVETSALQAFLARDPWLEARETTAAMQQSKLASAINWMVRTLTPAKPKFMEGTSLMCVDLNKYRPDVNVEMLIDMGVRLFMLRVGGPTRWVYGDERYEVDETFVPYYERIRAYAKAKGITVWIMGYGVYNPWANEQSNYTALDPQVKWLKEATRNHLCDQYCWDNEIGSIWKDGKETFITGVNLVKGIRKCMEDTFQEMERNKDGSYKMPVHYSAAWFIDKWYKQGFIDWLDVVNKDIQNRHLLTWMAWLPLSFTDVYNLVKDIFIRCITPTGLQQNAYLWRGGLPADLWQFTFTGKGPWLGPISKAGIDMSTGYAQSATATQYALCANLTTQPPTDPTPPDPIVTGSFVTTAQFNAFLADYNQHTHTTGGPIHAQTTPRTGG